MKSIKMSEAVHRRSHSNLLKLDSSQQLNVGDTPLLCTGHSVCPSHGLVSCRFFKAVRYANPCQLSLFAGDLWTRKPDH